MSERDVSTSFLKRLQRFIEDLIPYAIVLGIIWYFVSFAVNLNTILEERRNRETELTAEIEYVKGQMNILQETCFK